MLMYAEKTFSQNTMSLIKDIYSQSFYQRFSLSLAAVIPSLNQKEFVELMLADGFEDKEWKDRMKHTTRVFHQFLPPEYPQAIRIIEQLIDQLRATHFGEDSLAFIFLPDYIETYGLDDYETSVSALELVTQFVSCEFAVRPFLIRYGSKMLEQMKSWSLHESHKVRRFASEGSRPRLPWAMAVPALKKDPSVLLSILENLKNDPSEWVRRSVANNLNDIAKSHPEIVLELAQLWSGHTKETDALIKHGSRTLLKQGHPEILKHYGLESINAHLSDFQIITPEVKIGANLEFSFLVTNDSATVQKIRLEYAVYYVRQNGQSSKKVFKISERIYQPAEKAKVQRIQKFILITTRKFYAGTHQLSVILNGEEKEIKSFELNN